MTASRQTDRPAADPAGLKALLDHRVALYNQPGFVPADPVSVPHRFSRREDIEIAGFFAAVLAWGNRTSIINNCNRLLRWMDEAPHQFVLQHEDGDLKPMLAFAHRTFNATDLLYFMQFLQGHYRRFTSLEDAFVPEPAYAGEHTGAALIHFHDYFFSLPEFPERTRKHIATPARGSACKRLSMYLRWMVRDDGRGVDFGLWKKLQPAQLICPLDVHVARVSHRLGLIENEKADWRNAVLLTNRLKEFCPEDPAVYDFALFSLGAEERF
jgi:uncharacterized protein (TIGR02757 family)